jgi:hypothetical protein
MARHARAALRCVAAGALGACLMLGTVTARAIEVAPVSEREARQLAGVLPAAVPLPSAGGASQPVLLKLKQPANAAAQAQAQEDRTLQLDGHPVALLLAALALLLWGMRRSRRG